MSDLGAAGLTQLVDVVDNASKAALVAVDATVAGGRVTAETVVDTLGDTLKNAVDKLEELRAAYIEQLRRVAGAVSDAVPGPL